MKYKKKKYTFTSENITFWMTSAFSVSAHCNSLFHFETAYACNFLNKLEHRVRVSIFLIRMKGFILVPKLLGFVESFCFASLAPPFSAGGVMQRCPCYVTSYSEHGSSYVTDNINSRFIIRKINSKPLVTKNAHSLWWNSGSLLRSRFRITLNTTFS